MELNFNELRELVTTLSQTDISELTLKSADFELTLRKKGAAATGSPETLAPIEPTTRAVAEVTQLVTAPVAGPTPPPTVDANLVEIDQSMHH